MAIQFDISKMTVMIVDDTALMRANHKKALVSMGFRDENVYFAENGAVALSSIATLLKQNGKLDLIICDWDMPQVSGLQVIQMIRKVPATKCIPFLMVTGHSKKEDIILAVKNGVDAYIVKPFKEDVFLDKVLDALAQGFVRN